MMMKQGKLRFLSARILCVIIGLIVVIGILSLLLLFDSFKESSVNVVILAFCIGLTLLLCCFFWKMIVKPFNQMEKNLGLFLDGYTTSHLMGEDNIFYISPAYEGVITKIQYMLQSQELLNLNKRQAQYLALQNQINPHFLYNTLESIRGEALIAGLSGVADMTESLAKFFRYTITKVENLVSVEEELDNCETYFGIQKYRFGDRLQLHIEYDPDEWEEIMNCRIPKLTLQPIMENSIIHGTELKIGEGNLWIRFRRTENRLVITISDDGVGMDEETLERLNETLNRGVDAITQQQEEKKGGIALANVNNRIHLIFGDEYGMHVYSMAECGTDVEISIPVVTRLEQKEEHV